MGQFRVHGKTPILPKLARAAVGGWYQAWLRLRRVRWSGEKRLSVRFLSVNGVQNGAKPSNSAGASLSVYLALAGGSWLAWAAGLGS
jgi:hypothetical protein